MLTTPSCMCLRLEPLTTIGLLGILFAYQYVGLDCRLYLNLTVPSDEESGDEPIREEFQR